MLKVIIMCEKIYMDSYMADHLEVEGLRQLVLHVGEIQGPSKLHGHNP
jgi:hypothetical protein